MLKTNAILEVTKEDRTYTLTLPANSMLGEVHDVLHNMLSFVLQKINEAAQTVKPAEAPAAEATPIETPKAE